VINANLDAAQIASSNFNELASKVLNSIRPSDRLQGATLTGGRSATELALLDAFRLRKGTNSAIGFGGSNHGQGLSMTQFAHPGMSMSMGWPCLNYPTSDEQTLDEVRTNLRNGNVAAVMLEPVNWQTGAVISSKLINQIGELAHESDAALIVDETNTGCGATGNGFWAYNGDAADYVSFGKRTQATGYFTNAHEGVVLGGSEMDVALLALIKKEMDGNNLIDQVQRVGKSLQSSVSRAA